MLYRRLSSVTGCSVLPLTGAASPSSVSSEPCRRQSSCRRCLRLYDLLTRLFVSVPAQQTEPPAVRAITGQSEATAVARGTAHVAR